MRDWGSRRLADAQLLLSVLAFAFVACQHIRPPSCSGEVADLAASGRRELHVRLELIRKSGPQRHEVIVQTEPGRITAIGLTPIGTSAFRLTHDSAGIEVENRIGRYLGYEPRRVYDAIVQALLARRPGPGDPAVTAVVTLETDGIRVENERCGYSARLVVIADDRA